MQIKNEKDFWAGLMFMGFGLAAVTIAVGPPAFLVAAWKSMGWGNLQYGYQMGTAVRMGPAYFPTMLGGLLAFLGFIVFLRGFFSELPPETMKANLSFGILDFVVGVALFAGLGYASKVMFKSGDYGMLAASVILAVLSFLFRPKTKPLILILACGMVFAYLLKPLGLVLATILLVFVAALGGHEYKTKEVAIVAVVLSIFSVVVFVYGLTLPFQIWPAAFY
ncbi:MAG: tripartite tricarboxylate transporter TctB family protein [Betaproteobacteria bacterium]|nr:tripartite tricarboxylate transporter TctB family protein [Betaproteobacteria bacterium]